MYLIKVVALDQYETILQTFCVCLLLVLVLPSNSGPLGFFSVAALPCLLRGGLLMGAQVKLDMQCAHDPVGSVGHGG